MIKLILKNIIIINDEYKDKGFILKGVFGSYARHKENDFIKAIKKELITAWKKWLDLKTC